MTAAIEPTGSLVRWSYLWIALLAIALVIVAIAIQGFGFLTPINVLVCLELQKSERTCEGSALGCSAISTPSLCRG